MSLNILRKQCVQYTKMAIVCFAFGDALMWLGIRLELNIMQKNFGLIDA